MAENLGIAWQRGRWMANPGEFPEGGRRVLRLLLVAAAISSSWNAVADSRGAGPPGADQESAVESFEPDQSAALFVGVSRFPYDPSVAEVRYAVDDAVDLASLLSLDEEVKLVEPARVVLALSGEPEKEISRRNLERLVAAGAQVRSAAAPDVLNALDEQSRIAGKKGLLIFTFATHGFTKDGAQYLLSATSILKHSEGTISESAIRDIASQSDAMRSLIIIDACRERLTEGRRSGLPDARSAAALLRAMDGVHGQVVLSAAAAGQYAYDDEVRRNGVFTAALIDGLRCQAAVDARGIITVDSLSSFVEQYVLTWIRKHRNPRITRATQVSFEGNAKTMPLAECGRAVSEIPSTPAASTAPALLYSLSPETGKPATPVNWLPVSAQASAADPAASIVVILFDDRGEPNPQLAAAANDAIRESGYRPMALPRFAGPDSGARQLAAGRVESLGGMHLSNVCRAVFAGTVVQTVVTEKDAALHGLIATHLRIRFYLIDSGSGTILSSIDSEARGGGFTKESSEIQALERAGVNLRAEMRRMKWAELLAQR